MQKEKIKKIKKIIIIGLFYYSVLLSLILVGGGIFMAKNWHDYVNTFLLVPILAFLLLNYKDFYKIK